MLIVLISIIPISIAQDCTFSIDDSHFDISSLYRKEGWSLEQPRSEAVSKHLIRFNLCQSDFQKVCSLSQPQQNRHIQSYYEITHKGKKDCYAIGFADSLQLEKSDAGFTMTFRGESCLQDEDPDGEMEFTSQLTQFQVVCDSTLHQPGKGC